VTDLISLAEHVERSERKPLQYLRQLNSQIEVLATAHSGAQGLLALTTTGVVFAWKPPGLGTGVKTWARERTAIVGAQVDGADLLLQDATQPTRFKSVQPPQRAQEMILRLTRTGSADSLVQPSGPARSALKILPPKTRGLVDQVLRPDENVHVVFVGVGGQAMVATDDRMLVAKSGFMAGATFGSKTLDFPYDQITGIELHVGAMTGYLQIVSPSFQGNLPQSYWTRDKGHDPWKLPNCIPVGRNAVTAFQGSLALVRERLAKGYWTDGVGAAPPEAAPDLKSPANTGTGDLAAQIKELAALHEAGALSDDEFAQAKQKLLS
jgi:hypothetical protein